MTVSNRPIPGREAPPIRTVDQDGRPFDLADLRGRKVVLYFYPKDDTPGCTKEACSFRDHHDKLLEAGYAVVGVSPDSERRHRNFIAKYDLPFTLLPDPGKEIIRAYGVWGRKKFMGREYEGVLRTTFVIDGEGKVERVIDKVNTADAAGQILEGEKS